MLRRIKSCKHRIQVNSCRDSKRKKSKLTRVSIPFDSREEETNIRNNRVSVFSRSDGVNLGCGAEQSHERNAIESRQRRNPRGGCKIRIVALSRIMKRSTRYVTLSEREREREREREIKAPFQLVRAFRSPAQLPTRTNVGNQEKSITLLVTRKSKDVGYLLSSPLFPTADLKFTRINARPLCRWKMLRGRANGCSRSYRSFV